MSSQAEQATILSENTVSNYVHIATLALIVYDTLLTLSREVEFIWPKKFKLGATLYMLARYSTLVQLSLGVVERLVHTSFQTCNALFDLGDVLCALVLIGIQGLLLARAYAVTDRKRLVLAVLIVLGFCTLLPNLIETSFNQCGATKGRLNTIRLFGDITTIASMLFDAVVVVVTLASTLGTWRIYKRSTWDKLSLTHLLAQQSLLRFGFVLTITLADAILPLTSRPFIKTVIGPIQTSLSTVIICRFHLDLQRQNTRPNTDTSWGLPTISFRVATQRMHDAVMEEFGDSYPDAPVETETSWDTVVPDPDMHTAETEGDIAVVEDSAQLQDAALTMEV